MAVTLKEFVLNRRMVKKASNFDSATGNVGILYFETFDKTMGICFLVSDTAVTASHFNNWDDGEDLPLPSFLFDQTDGMLWILNVTDSWAEIGDVT